MKPNESINEVKAWEEDIVIPTYKVGQPEKNPIFCERRVYQGSSGVVYPNPVIEKIFNEKVDKIYHACFLENEYLKIMVLPELGGRVQMAYDKLKQRHFIYYNEVIKPALVGLAGPWISGGIEFNWPQHHRPSTFEPIDFKLENNLDGSKTIWCNEIERMFRTKGSIGFTLYPGKAYLELKVKLYNRTPFPQTFLWWANPAVHVNEHYQSVFPPDVNAVFDHGKRDVCSFPIAKGKYYKVDYSAGVDISRYKNIPVPTSFMAVNSKYDFIGGYEHDTNGGVLHVADHHISPGKKQWTWGYGDFGKAWDRNLTDANGPYIEIMCGVFTDNQPDFSWLMPYEEKSFTQYFLPYRDIGIVKNATKEALINFEIEKNKLTVKAYTTSVYRNARIEILNAGKIIFNEKYDLSPNLSVVKSIQLEDEFHYDNIEIKIFDENGNILVSGVQQKCENQKLPEPAKAAKLPNEILQNEQLFLTGLHLEQYRHATYDPIYYYLEALARDAGDVRNNNAMGLWLLRRGQFYKSEQYFRKAIETLTERNPNPYDGEPFYNLGVSLMFQDKLDDSYDSFYKAIWNAAWQDAGYFSLTQLDIRKGDFANALDHIDCSLIRNWHNQKSRHLKAVILRKLGKTSEALEWIEDSLAIDNFNIGCLYEKYLLLKAVLKTENANDVLTEVKKLMRNWVHNYIEYALDYSNAGLYGEAIQLLSEMISNSEKAYPMVYYFLGYFESRSGNKKNALEYYLKAEMQSSDYCFPNRIEEILALTDALNLNPKDSKALYYLGNFWYANRQYDDALVCWEKSTKLNSTFPTVWRNLAQLYFNKLKNLEKARFALEKAFELNPYDARVLMELDQLFKIVNESLYNRETLLEKNIKLVEERDDLYVEYLTILNCLKKYNKVCQLISQRRFNPWEGGEGKVSKQFLVCCIESAKKQIIDGNYSTALELLAKTENYPHNLGEGKLFGIKENDVDFLKGIIHQELGNLSEAILFYNKAAAGGEELAQAIFYNDPQPDTIFYTGLAWKKLGDLDKADSVFNRFISFGTEHMNDKIRIDYFAVSLPDLLVFDQNLDLKNQVHCLYLIGLGYLGLESYDLAIDYFNKVFSLDCSHQGAIIHLDMIKLLKSIFRN
ncbi:MAG: DUF5107 domain-containing protein [Ignavibacteriaceae bacterium]|nr:DUF5107 domain-containing protein [Ignavibacteriaceae bacterium]